MSEAKPAPKPIYCDKNGRILVPLDGGLFQGYSYDDEFVVKTIEPTFQWTGAKIPYGLWQQIVSFMKWSQATHKAEAHLALFYNTEEKIWAAWAFPQVCIGMTVRLKEDDARFAEDRKKFGKGWIMAGSVHHHCEGGAFQSSVDSADEMNKEGIHITIGKTSSEEIDIHARQVWMGVMVTTSILDWVGMPDWVDAFVPKKLSARLKKPLFESPALVDFPEEWKTRIITQENRPSFTVAGPRSLVGSAGASQHGSSSGSVNGHNDSSASDMELRKFLCHLAGTEGISLTKAHYLLNLSPEEIQKLDDNEALACTRLNNAIMTSRYNFGWALAILEDMLEAQKELNSLQSSGSPV